jgi:hypothetical protein
MQRSDHANETSERSRPARRGLRALFVGVAAVVGVTLVSTGVAGAHAIDTGRVYTTEQGCTVETPTVTALNYTTGLDVQTVTYRPYIMDLWSGQIVYGQVGTTTVGESGTGYPVRRYDFWFGKQWGNQNTFDSNWGYYKGRPYMVGQETWWTQSGRNLDYHHYKAGECYSAPNNNLWTWVPYR